MSDFICNVEVWNGLTNRIKYEDGVDTAKALEMVSEYRKNALLFAGKHSCKENVLYYIIQHDEALDNNYKLASPNRR